jgi:23S rRNA (adenine-N6)-dimethyltransferase
MHRRDHRSPSAQVLSQHRLRDNAAERLVASTGLAPPNLVFDLGAGEGQLTAALLERYPKVIAVEVERELWTRLRSRFHGEPRVTAVLADLLAVPLPDRSPYKVVANLPYGLTAQFMRRLLALSNPPLETYLVVQREAAAKWAGLGHETAASVVMKNRFEASVVLALRRDDFMPRPNVDSVVLRLRRLKRPRFGGDDGQAFERFVRRGFGEGQRTAARNLAGLVRPEVVRAVSNEYGDLPSQPHELPFEAWVRLFASTRQRR